MNSSEPKGKEKARVFQTPSDYLIELFRSIPRQSRPVRIYISEAHKKFALRNARMEQVYEEFNKPEFHHSKAIHQLLTSTPLDLGCYPWDFPVHEVDGKGKEWFATLVAIALLLDGFVPGEIEDIEERLKIVVAEVKRLVLGDYWEIGHHDQALKRAKGLAGIHVTKVKEDMFINFI